MRTEVPISGEGAREDKTTTTVALDYGTLRLGKDQRLLIFGTPGQRRYDFMCRILARGALGLVVLIDHTAERAAEDLAYYLDLFGETIAEASAVVGVTHTDRRPGAAALDPYYEVLAARGLALPVLTVDARRRADTVMMIEALLANLE